MKILLLGTQHWTQKWVKNLASHGLSADAWDLGSIKPSNFKGGPPYEKLDPPVDALMITSSSVLATWPPDWMPPRIPLYVIGDASAQMALGLGFFDVRPAHEPHQSALIETIKSDFPQGGIVMWLRGKQVAQELEPEVVAPLLLRQYIHYEIVWDLQRILEMPDHLDLEEQTLCVLGSPTLARTLIERLPRNLRDLIHWVALGKSTFRCLANENKVHVLDAPTPEALAHCLLSIRLEKI